MTEAGHHVKLYFLFATAPFITATHRAAANLVSAFELHLL
jgi:hypothetical protein